MRTYTIAPTTMHNISHAKTKTRPSYSVIEEAMLFFSLVSVFIMILSFSRQTPLDVVVHLPLFDLQLFLSYPSLAHKILSRNIIHELNMPHLTMCFMFSSSPLPVLIFAAAEAVIQLSIFFRSFFLHRPLSMASVHPHPIQRAVCAKIICSLFIYDE